MKKPFMTFSLTVLACGAMAGCGGQPEDRPEARAAGDTSMYMTLRNRAFQASPGEAGIEVAGGEVWGALMEFRAEGIAITLLGLKDGTTSVYFESGGGIIGGGEHEAVRRATGAYLAAARAQAGSLRSTTSYPLPREGWFRFYVLTSSGVLTQEAGEREVTGGGHPLSPLFQAGSDVLTELRKMEEAGARP